MPTLPPPPITTPFLKKDGTPSEVWSKWLSLLQTNVGTSGGENAGWTKAFDLDLASQPNQTMSSDGAYTIGGVPFTKINSANEVAHLQLINGTGLRFKPTGPTDLTGGTRTLPALLANLSAVIPNYRLDMPVRGWCRMKAQNFAAQYDGLKFGFENGQASASNETFVVGLLQQDGSGRGSGLAVTQGNTSIGFSQNDNAPFNAYDLIKVEYPNGVESYLGVVEAGAYDTSDFPPALGLAQIGASPGNTFSASMALRTAWNMIVGVQRANSGTALVVDIDRLRLEYKA